MTKPLNRCTLYLPLSQKCFKESVNQRVIIEKISYVLSKISGMLPGVLVADKLNKNPKRNSY